MSRSKKKGKSPGYEYWSKRPMSGSTPGRWAKTKTHRLERKQGKTLTRKALKEEDESD